jgi:hypothetical protein
LSSPCAGSAPQKRNQPPPTQNFWPSLNLKEQSNLVRGNWPRISYKRSALLLPDIRLDRRHVRLERSSLLYFLSERHSRFDHQKRCRYASPRTYLRDTTCQGVRITPITCRSSLRWWDVGNTYAAVSESEVICDLRCGLKAKGNAPVGFRFEGVRNTPIFVHLP